MVKTKNIIISLPIGNIYLDTYCEYCFDGDEIEVVCLFHKGVDLTNLLEIEDINDVIEYEISKGMINGK